VKPQRPGGGVDPPPGAYLIRCPLSAGDGIGGLREGTVWALPSLIMSCKPEPRQWNAHTCPVLRCRGPGCVHLKAASRRRAGAATQPC